MAIVWRFYAHAYWISLNLNPIKIKINLAWIFCHSQITFYKKTVVNKKIKSIFHTVVSHFYLYSNPKKRCFYLFESFLCIQRLNWIGNCQIPFRGLSPWNKSLKIDAKRISKTKTFYIFLQSKFTSLSIR